MLITLIVIVAVLVVAVCVVGYYAEQQRRQRQLRERFGGEYDRAVSESGDKRRAQRELLARQKRHEQLDIRPLQPDRARDYREQWEATQTQFVDDPGGAIAEADTLIEALMSERGYPIGDFDTKVADLSVEHAEVLQHYRAAHDIAQAADNGDADTESLRRALMHYRALFRSLLDSGVEQHIRLDEKASAVASRTSRRTT